MKTATILLTVVLCLLGAAVCFADEPQMGTGKLNEAKSKFSPGAPKNTTVVYAAAGDSTKVTTDGTDAEGKPAHASGPANSMARTTLSPAIPVLQKGQRPYAFVG